MFRVACDDSWGLVIHGLCSVQTHSFHSETVGSYHDRLLNTVKSLNNFGGFICLYFYVYGCIVCMYVCAPYACSFHGGKKKHCILLELEL